MAAVLSLVVIVKNEAQLLPELLEVHRSVADELLVVDTGSSDGTPELARSAGARLEVIPWPGSFAEARNQAIALARGDWVLMLDADERLDLAAQDAVRATTRAKGTPRAVYTLIQRTYSDEAELIAWCPAFGRPEARGRSGYFDHALARLFPRHPALRFEGIIHELIEPSALRAKIKLRETDWLIHHYRDDQSAHKQAEKNALYLQLTRRKVLENPRSERARMELSQAATVCGHHEEAVASLAEFVQRRPSAVSAVTQLGIALLEADRPEEVRPRLQASLQLGCAADQARLWSLVGEAEVRLARHRMALEALRRAEALGEKTFRVCVNRGVAHLALSELEDAETCFRRASALHPKSVLPDINQALVVKMKGELHQAETMLEDAATRAPSIWQIHAHRAGIAFDLGKYAEAAQHADRALAIEPHGPEAELRACAAAMALGRQRDAVQYAEEAARRDPRYRSIADDLRGEA